MTRNPQKQPSSVAKIEPERKAVMHRLPCMFWICPKCGWSNRNPDAVPAGPVKCVSCKKSSSVGLIIYDNGAEATIG